MLNLSLLTELSPLVVTEQSLALQRADGHAGDLARDAITHVELSKTLSTDSASLQISHFRDRSEMRPVEWQREVGETSGHGGGES